VLHMLVAASGKFAGRQISQQYVTVIVFLKNE
jgi:hypothetical protein